MGKKKGSCAFPVARIKKMMQSDDDVGKIATSTPILVGKALECMIEDVLTAAASVAHSRRAKTVSPSHLKEAIDGADKFDFLRSTLARVPQLEPVSPDADVMADDADKKPVRKLSVTKRPRSPSSAGIKRPRASPRRSKASQSSGSEDDISPDASGVIKDDSIPFIKPEAEFKPCLPLPDSAAFSNPSKFDDDDEDYDEGDEEDARDSNDQQNSPCSGNWPSISGADTHGTHSKKSDPSHDDTAMIVDADEKEKVACQDLENTVESCCADIDSDPVNGSSLVGQRSMDFSTQASSSASMHRVTPTTLYHSFPSAGSYNQHSSANAQAPQALFTLQPIPIDHSVRSNVTVTNDVGDCSTSDRVSVHALLS